MNEIDAPKQDAEEMVAQLNALVEELENYPDSAIRETALDVVQITLHLYGETLRRILQSIASLPQKDEILARLFADEVIRSMLLIHDLLPISLKDRVAVALERLRPYLISQGADVELVSVAEECARLRLIRSGKGAPHLAVLEQEIRQALMEAAPDLVDVEIEGLAEQLEATAKAASYLNSLMASSRKADSPAKLVQLKTAPLDKANVNGQWVALIRANGLPEGQLRMVHFGEDNLLICKINGDVFAYRNACAEGSAPLDAGLFESPMLTCLCHGYRYDLRHQGKCLEKPILSLVSLPAMIEDEKIKVAL